MNNLLLVTFSDMLTNVHTKTSLLLFLPIMIGIIAYHIGSRNSTSNGIIVSGLSVFGTCLLFFTFDPDAMGFGMVLGGVGIVLGLSSIYFLNKQRK